MSQAHPPNSEFMKPVVDLHAQVLTVVKKGHLAGSGQATERIEDEIVGLAVGQNQVLCHLLGHDGSVCRLTNPGFLRHMNSHGVPPHAGTSPIQIMRHTLFGAFKCSVWIPIAKSVNPTWGTIPSIGP